MSKQINDLIALQEQGQVLDYLCFWGHKQAGQGIDKSCLSQWFPAAFSIDAVRYPTAEHYMMASKARLFDDTAILNEILAAANPDMAKRLGRKVKNYDEEVWIAHRFQIVVDANYAKFSQHEKMADFLLKTGKCILVEASPVDRIWGIGLSRQDPDSQNPGKWQGLNLLGFALMEVREKLTSERQKNEMH